MLKKAYNAMIMNGNGYLRLNDVSGLHYYTMDASGRKCDKLVLRFLYVAGIKGDASFEVYSRTYDDVVAEVSRYTKQYFAACANELISYLKEGVAK